jgi:hypothetical protein
VSTRRARRALAAATPARLDGSELLDVQRWPARPPRAGAAVGWRADASERYLALAER